MKRNIPLLTNQVRDKLTAKCVTAIVAEAFINALPLNKDEIVYESAYLTNYVSQVMSKMHPENILDRAFEATMGDHKAHLYVTNLKEAVESVVDSATKRIVQEALSNEHGTPEIIEQVKLDSEETQKLVDASKKTGTDAVAKIVKDNLIDAIKDEKNAYEEAAKLREEIKEVIKGEPESMDETFDDSAVESYLNLVLTSTDVRQHVSFFSRLQDVCMEALFHSTEEYYGEIPYETMEKITLESTLPYFDLSQRSLIEEIKSMNIVTESAIDEGCDPEEKAHKMKKIAKTAFICSICIMTMLQTLKTMHLAKPTVNEVRTFVDNPTNVRDMVNTNLDKVEDGVDNATDAVKKSVALGAVNAVEMEQAKEQLENIRALLDKMVVTESESGRKSRIINKLNSAIESLSDKLPEETTTMTDSFTNRLKEENLANLEYGIKLLSRKPMVQELQIAVRSDMNTSENAKVEVEIKGMDAGGSCVATYMVSMHTLKEFGATVAEVIRDTANYLDLGPKPVKMYFTDSGYAVPLKG